MRWLPRSTSLPRWLRGLAARIFQAHFTADLRSLAAGRIALASVLLLDLALRAGELRLWYTNGGIIPNHTLLWSPAWDHVFSLFYLASYTHEAVGGFAMCAVAYVCLLIGFRTRIAQVGSLICLISLHGRMLLFDNGGDVALGLLTIWTTFLPTGARFSVDAVLARAHAQERINDTPYPLAHRGRAASFAVLAVTWQLALIYLFNAIHKQGSTWREGSAVHYVLHLDRLATPLAVWLRGWIPPELCRALSWTALAIEWALPFLLLSPFGVRGCRRIAIVLVVMLHSGFGLFMRLGIFVPAMISYTPNFLHAADWDALARWWGRGRRRAALGAWLGARTTAAILGLARAPPGRPGRVARRADHGGDPGTGAGVDPGADGSPHRAGAGRAPGAPAAAPGAGADGRGDHRPRDQPALRREQRRPRRHRPPQRAAGGRGGQLHEPVPGVVDVRPRCPDL